MICPNNIVITDGETPCNGILTLDLLEYIETHTSSDSITFDLVFYDYEGVEIDGNNLIITLTEDRPKEVNTSIIVKYGNKQQYVGVTIKFKSLCEEVECSEVEYCDSCTGDCIQGEVDIDATIPIKGKVKLI